MKKGGLSWGSRQGFPCCQQWFAKRQLPVVSSWGSCTLVLIITIFSSNTVLLRWVSNKPFEGWGDTISSSTCINFCNSYKPSWGWKGRKVNRSCGVAVPPPASLSLLLFQCPKGTGGEPWPFFCSRSWVPAGLLNTKMKFHTVSLEWKQHDVSVERVEQYVKGNRTERREQLTPGAEQICPLCFTLWICFQLRPACGSHNTSPQLWAGKWNYCRKVVPETNLAACGKWKLRLNFKTSWKHSDAEMQSEAIQ